MKKKEELQRLKSKVRYGDITKEEYRKKKAELFGNVKTINQNKIKPKNNLKVKRDYSTLIVILIFLGIILTAIFVVIPFNKQNQKINNITTQSNNTRSIEVYFNIDQIETSDAKIYFVINTNLPNDTQFTLELINDEYGYVSKKHFQIENGLAKTDIFDIGNGPLVNGSYDLIVVMDDSETQPLSVQKIIGKYGDNLTGKNVTKINQEYTIESEVTITINDGIDRNYFLTQSAKQRDNLISLYNQLLTEYQQEKIAYNEYQWQQFINEWKTTYDSYQDIFAIGLINGTLIYAYQDLNSLYHEMDNDLNGLSSNVSEYMIPIQNELQIN